MGNGSACVTVFCCLSRVIVVEWSSSSRHSVYSVSLSFFSFFFLSFSLWMSAMMCTRRRRGKRERESAGRTDACSGELRHQCSSDVVNGARCDGQLPAWWACSRDVRSKQLLFRHICAHVLMLSLPFPQCLPFLLACTADTLSTCWTHQ